MAALSHRMLGILALVGLLITVACSQTGAPTTSSAPQASASTAAASKAAASTSPAASPAASASGGIAAKPDWKDEWDKTLAAAKKEGKVVVAGAPGDIYRDAMMAFQTAYPDLQIEFTGSSGSQFAPKILAERDAGQFLWDVHFGGATTMFNSFIPKGVLDPIRPALLLPEVLDNSKWLGGFEDSWMDKDHKSIFAFEGRLNYSSYVNRDLAPESQLSKVDQLLDPAWKGKIGVLDPRVAGSGSGRLGYLLMLKGESWVRKFLGQDLVVMADSRSLAEGVMRGRFPIGMGIDLGDIELFKQQGLMTNVAALDPNSAEGGTITTGFANLAFVNKAPHPNAAKVFINWLLSQQGQKSWVSATSLNSRRLDVEGPADSAPRPNIKYRDINREENLEIRTQAMNLAKELIK